MNESVATATANDSVTPTTAGTSTLVTANLLRTYRPIALWFFSAAIIGIGAGLAAVIAFGDVRFSLWVMIGGSAARYWLSAVGVLLITAHLRQFVATGVTRREFLAGAGLFGLIAAVLFTVVVLAGHGLEQWAVGLGGPLPGDYPAVSVVPEFLHVLAAELAYLVSGATVAAGFYRLGPLRGFLVLVPGVLPAAIAEMLLGRGPHGELLTRLVPLEPAVTASLAVTAVAALICRQLIRDVAIRRAGG
jgi:hypothetical protein